MEHIVQLGITIDDDAIKKRVEQQVLNRVAGDIKADCMKQLCGKDNFQRFEYDYKVKELITETTNSFLEMYKDEIIEFASDKLADKLSRTKAVKEAVSKLLEV